MKKSYLLAGALVAAMAAGLSMQAGAAWVKIRNGTPWDLTIWWKGHHSRKTEANAYRLGMGKLVTLALSDKSMNGPLYAARVGDVEEIGGVRGGEKYYDIFSSPTNAYFFPINKKTTFKKRTAIYKALKLEPTADGTGIRIKQTWPDLHFYGFGRNPYVEMNRKRVWLVGGEQAVK